MQLGHHRQDERPGHNVARLQSVRGLLEWLEQVLDLGHALPLLIRQLVRVVDGAVRVVHALQSALRPLHVVDQNGLFLLGEPLSLVVPPTPSRLYLRRWLALRQPVAFLNLRQKGVGHVGGSEVRRPSTKLLVQLLQPGVRFVHRPNHKG